MQHKPASHVVVDGIKLRYARSGSGRPVVYIHGALTTLEEGPVALREALPDFEMIAFDRPGHGESGRDETTGSIWRQAELVHEALDQLGIVKPVVVGHSFGGAVAMALALSYPASVQAIVALAPIAFPENRAEIFLLGPRALPVSGDWLSWASRAGDATLLPLLYRAMFLPQSMPAAFAETFPFELGGGRTQLQADGQDALGVGMGLARAALMYATCRTPVDVFVGDRDMVVNPDLHGRLLAAILPLGRVTTLKGLGHMGHHFAAGVVAEAISKLHDRPSENPSSSISRRPQPRRIRADLGRSHGPAQSRAEAS